MPEGRRTIDKVALQEFLMNDAERLHRYVTAKIPPDLASVTSADDILQEVWIAAFRVLSNFRMDGPDALARWITTLTNRTLVDTLKTARGLKRCGRQPDVRMADRRESSMTELFHRIAPSRPTPSSETSTKESVQAVRTALAGLPDDRRRAIYMRHIEGRSVAEISRTMQRSMPAVNSLLFRARRDLCDRLGRASKYFSDVPSSGKTAG